MPLHQRLHRLGAPARRCALTSVVVVFASRARKRRAGVFTFLLLAACTAFAQQVRIPTREGVTTAIYWEASEGAKATVLLLPGGEGGYGKIVDGRPGSANFLVRSVPHFIAAGLNVAVFGRPSDSNGISESDRVSANHMADLRAAIAFAREKGHAPVWVVGTSMGTVSATALAIRAPEAGFAGIVLTSSIIGRMANAVPRQELEKIRVPVLLMHHAKDACPVCQPYFADSIIKGLVNAPVKKLIMFDGGRNPKGDYCGPTHWHGYIGAEKEAVDQIAAWIVSR